MAYKPQTLKETAERIRQALNQPPDPEVRNRYWNSEQKAFLAIRDFLDDFDYYVNERSNLIAEPPNFTSSRRFDAYLAALAEHLAYHYNLPCPSWAQEPERFLDQWWFTTSAQSLHALALATSPASFRRRGIFIRPDALERV